MMPIVRNYSRPATRSAMLSTRKVKCVRVFMWRHCLSPPAFKSPSLPAHWYAATRVKVTAPSKTSALITVQTFLGPFDSMVGRKTRYACQHVNKQLLWLKIEQFVTAITAKARHSVYVYGLLRNGGDPWQRSYSPLSLLSLSWLVRSPSQVQETISLARLPWSRFRCSTRNVFFTTVSASGFYHWRLFFLFRR